MKARSLLDEAERIDAALYTAVATTPTPTLDGAMRRLSSAADYSRLSISSSILLAVFGGDRGRRAAASGLVAVAATSGIANLAVKPLSRRRRPDRTSEGVPEPRHIPMPASASFPSGHTAAAVAFASAAGRAWPLVSIPLHLLAALVGYSRVHTGVHYPGDVIAGALLGAVIADAASPLTQRASAGRSNRAG